MKGEYMNRVYGVESMTSFYLQHYEHSLILGFSQPFATPK